MVAVPRVNQEVITPQGQGIVQGRMRNEEGDLRVLVAFMKDRSAEHTVRVVRDIWQLLDFDVSEVQPV